MNKKTAIILAIACMDKEIKRLAQQANLHDLYQSDDIHTIKASERRKDIREAIKILRSLMQQ